MCVCVCVCDEGMWVTVPCAVFLETKDTDITTLIVNVIFTSKQPSLVRYFFQSLMSVSAMSIFAVHLKTARTEKANTIYQ